MKISGTVDRKIFSSDNFKVYAIKPIQTSEKIKLNEYGNITIVGNFHELDFNITYEIEAELKEYKGKDSYCVSKIYVDKPKTLEETYSFLSEILTKRQADALFKEYPNILEMIENSIEPDLSRVHGIGKKTWEKIKNKLISNFYLIELVDFFEGYLTISTINKLFKYFPSIEKIKEEVYKDPYYCLCSLDGIGFKKADDIILQMSKLDKFDYDLKSSIQRCRSAMSYKLLENENSGNTRMSLIDLKNDIDMSIPECCEYFTQILKDDMDIKDERERKFKVFPSNEQYMISSYPTYQKELRISEKIKEGLLYDNKWNIDCSSYDKIDGYSASDEQKSVLDIVCKNNIIILQGAAGTGKSSSVMLLLEMLRNNYKTFLQMSPTGKAAKVLKQYTKIDASTIHRGLGYKNIEGQWKWEFNEDNKLNIDILILDEASMIDISLFNHVLDAIDFAKTKLLIIGDANQLPSVSCGNLLHDMLTSQVIPIVNLTKVFRYEEGGLMKVATDVRNRKKYLDDGFKEKAITLGNNKDYTFIKSDKDHILNDSLIIYKKLLSLKYDPKNIIVLSPYKKGNLGASAINSHLQKLANENVQANGNRVLKYGDRAYYEGDLVMQSANNYKAKTIPEYFINASYEELSEYLSEYELPEVMIANGETGIILEIIGDYMIIDFNGNVVCYEKGDLANLDLGYAMTIHKSQGSSSDVVILLTSSSHTYMLNSNLIYVGLTRMKKKCFHLGDINTVNRAIRIKENFNRNTNLLDMLRN